MHLPPEFSAPPGVNAQLPLEGIRVVLLAVNVPGPVAAQRLNELGARVLKIEPLHGDPLAALSPDWYRKLHHNVEVHRLDLRTEEARPVVDEWLSNADLFITSFRPSSLVRLTLDHTTLAARFPQLLQVAIVGESGERAEIAGHDLTYQAGAGLLVPPAMPRTLLADLAGAERAVSAALSLLFARARGHASSYAEVSLSDAVRELAAPLHFGLTTTAGPLGGVYPFYRLYQTQNGWIAVAALEPQFVRRLTDALGLASPTAEQLAAVFATNTSAAWEAWAAERDLPLAALHVAQG